MAGRRSSPAANVTAPGRAARSRWTVRSTTSVAASSPDTLRGARTAAAFAAELGALTTLLRAAPLEPHRCEVERRSRRAARRVPWAGSAAVVAALALGITSLPYASSPSTRGASLTAADLGRSLVPVKLPIGQRSAERDFVAPPVVLEA